MDWQESKPFKIGDRVIVDLPPPLTWWDEFLWRWFRIERAGASKPRELVVTHASDSEWGGKMRLVIVESPYGGDVAANTEYARRAVRDALSRGEAPIASHLLYTQPGILRDEVPEERRWGIDAGLAWLKVADATVVYEDRGISSGMQYGIAAAADAGRPIEFRRIESD